MSEPQAEYKTENNVPATMPIPPVKFSKTKAHIKKQAVKYKNIPDMSTKEGYEWGKDAKRVLTKERVIITKEMGIQKEAAQKHIKDINSKGGELVKMYQDIEAPIYAAKKAQDDKVAKEKADALVKEQNRIDDIQELVADIDGLTAGLLNADVATIQERLDAANKIVITDDVYMEFVEAASVALAQTKEQLTAGVETAKNIAAQQEEINKRQLEQDQRDAVAKIAEKIAEIQMIPVELMDATTIEMGNEVSRLDLLDPLEFGDLSDKAIATIEDAIRKLTSMIESKEKIEAQEKSLREQQEKIDNDAAEAKRLQEVEAKRIQDAANEKAKAEELAERIRLKHEELAARMPEDMKLRGYMDSLLAIDPPEVEDEHSVAVLRDMLTGLSDINKMVYDSTQSPEVED